MNLGQLGKSAIGQYSGIKAEIFTPKQPPVLAGDYIKGAIFTNGSIEFGWVYRDGYSYPKIYYYFYDSEAATPAYSEVLLGDISWGSSRIFEVKWIGTDMYSEEDLNLFNLYLDNIKVTSVTNNISWTYEDYLLGLISENDADSVGFLIKKIYLYKLNEAISENAYEGLKYAFERQTYNVLLEIKAHDNMFYVRTSDWKY